uniref:Uncharacterized protein n=1 Tax=Onchocerca volvulus TaxID=6282 RepID=A0A8R1TKZ6_ONCVO
MPEEEVGWIKIARRILGQYRGVIIGDILDWKQILLKYEYLPCSHPGQIFQVAMVFFALSIIWHSFTWPTPMSALQWNFSILPQSLVANSHSAPQIISTSCLDQMETKSQSETVQCKMNGKVYSGVGIRLKNIILDSILTVYETIIDSLSLASEFISNMFGWITAINLQHKRNVKLLTTRSS